LISKDFDRQLVFLKVIDQELGDAIYVMMVFVIEFRSHIFTSIGFSSVLLIIHIELIFTIDIITEVFWQVRDMRYFDFEIQWLIQ